MRASYVSLLRVQGVGPLYAVSLFSRMAAGMWVFLLTLVALAHFRSPQLAGAVGFASLAPALPVGLLTGTLLDRHGRRRLIVGDQALSAIVTLATFWAFSLGVLTPALLVTLVGLGAVTLPLTQIGTRSLKPLVVPAALWDRANAVDNAITAGAAFAATALAGLLLTIFGPAIPLLIIGFLWVMGAICGIWLPDSPLNRSAAVSLGGIWKSTIDGVRYALRNPTLRITSMMLPCVNAAIGMGELTLTAILLQATGSPAVVSWVRSLEPIVAVGSNLAGGRLRSRGRERWILVVTLMGQGVLYAIVAAWPSAPMIIVAIIAVAVLGGPRLIAFTSTVQRSTDPALYARTTSATTILGVMGTPLGAAFAGIALGISPIVAILSTTALLFLPALLALNLPSPGVDAPQTLDEARGGGGGE